MENIHEYLLENLFDGVYFVDTQKIITYWNKSAERITGYSREEVVSKRCSDRILRHIDRRGNELCVTACPLQQTIIDGKIRDSEIFLHHKQGHRVPVSVRVSPVRNENGNIIGAVEIFNDRTDRTDMIRLLEKIQKQTFIDPVTKVGNRKYAQINLTNRYTEMREHHVLFGAMFLLVKDLKSIEAAYGLSVANSALEMAAKTIKNYLKPLDAVGRWTDDTFVVILPNISDSSVLKDHEEQIIKFIQNSWLHVKDEIVHVSVSAVSILSDLQQTLLSMIETAEQQLNRDRSS